MLFTPSDSGQRSPPTSYRGCWHVVSRGFLLRYRQLHAISCIQVSSLKTELYNPKAFFAHAASLRQGSPHCAIFPTAASRRSLDRLSVPMWPFTLSGRLLIVALVSLYLTNQLIRRELIFRRGFEGPFHGFPLYAVLAVVSNCCSPPKGRFSRVTHPSATKNTKTEIPVFSVRLACVRHAASVRPEPGSNSPMNSFFSLKFVDLAFTQIPLIADR